MYKLVIKEKELLNEDTYEIIQTKSYTIMLEHSLVSISKWESIYQEPFFEIANKPDIDRDKIIAYVKCMTITQNIDDIVYTYIDNQELTGILEYMNSRQTATVINNTKKNEKNDTFITSELIYYWMVALRIPFECQRWHINRLLTLVNICNIKQDPESNKLDESEVLSRYERMNNQRLSELKRGLR